MSTRRTRRTAAAAEITEEIITVETRSKRTRAAPKKAASSKSKAAKDTTASSRSNAQPASRSDAVASTPAPAATPAPATNKRRLRSTTEAASPLRALDEQPAKKQRTIARKPSTPAPAPVQPAPNGEDEDEDEEIPVFFSTSEPLLSYPFPITRPIKLPFAEFENVRFEIQMSALEGRNADLQAECNNLREERDSARAELSRLQAYVADFETQLHPPTEPELQPQTSPVKADTPYPEFDSFDVERPEPAKPAFMTGDESAMALLRHVQEASKAPAPLSPTSTNVPTSPASPRSPTPSAAEVHQASPTPATGNNEIPSTPSRGLFGSFASSFTAIRNLFGSATPAPPSPTPSRRPPADTMTEVLTMPPTPVGERPKRPSKKSKKQNRIVKALLKGIDQQDVDKATVWAKQIAAELKKDSTAGDKRKRLETPVLFRDLQHFPASKPWESGFSFPEDILDLEDEDVVPPWAVYLSMIEEEHETKKTKTAHVSSVEDDMPASLNEVFGAQTASLLDLHPRRSIDPSPMFNTTFYHTEGNNIFNELRGQNATTNDREDLQSGLMAADSQAPSQVEKPLPKAHDPVHGSFSVPDSDSEEEEEEARAQPVWTQAPPPPPTPAHTALPNSSHNEEVERQRQKLMKHTPHKPSRLQQVSYPSPSALSDAGESPLKTALKDDIFGEIPQPEPLTFDDDPELAAAHAAARAAGGVQVYLDKMKNWSMPVISYDSDEEDLSPL
ncbi:hypothetical protein SVAN01_02948 [Stagonosporopsis vannaccii]|nr:hypothetical protein SVAN01_02948 [Stagonosporopsis vannaccii]